MSKDVLIFGAGSVGAHHANACRFFNFNVFITDIKINQISYFKNRLYPSRYKSWDNKIKLLNYKNIFKIKKKFDLIIIATSPINHLKVFFKINKNLKYKKILIEKPIFVYNQIKVAEKLAPNKRKKVFCGFNHELSQSIIFLKKYITKNKKDINKINIYWKESFYYLLKAHPWIKSLNNTYLSNVSIGGGSLHEFSHAVHLMNNFNNLIFGKKRFKFKLDIKFKKYKNKKFDNFSKILCFDSKKKIAAEINCTDKPPVKMIKIFGKKEICTWQRDQIYGKEMIIIKKNSKIILKKVFFFDRTNDFINKIKKLFSKKKNDIKYLKFNNFKNSLETTRLINRCIKNI